MVANSFCHYNVYHDKFPFIKNVLSYVEAKMHNAYDVECSQGKYLHCALPIKR